jgi:nucleoside-diphosphate-sugar epimerase
MKILVIGGNRFVGKKVAYELSKLANVAVLNRSGTGPNKVKVIKWDRNEPFNIENDYNVILDFCLFKPAQAQHLVNWLKPNQKYIFISSGAAYKDANCLSYNEEMCIGGRSGFGDYGVEKADCENIVKQIDTNYMIIRPPYIVGHDCPRPRISYYIRNILNNRPVEVAGTGNKPLSFIWANDIVNTLVDMSITNQYNIKDSYNIVNEDVYSARTLIEEISLFLNKKANIIENGTSSPFIDEHLLLSPLKLGRKFSSTKQNLPEFFDYIKSTL